MTLFDDDGQPPEAPAARIDLDPKLPPRAPDRDTPLHEVRKWVQENQREGVNCPACGQLAKTYRRKLNSGMARGLIELYRHCRRDFGHLLNATGMRGGDAAKLVFWGLIEEERTPRPDGGRAGWWRVTDEGFDFLRGVTQVHSHALVYDNECLGMDGDWVTISDCLGEPFDFTELMEA